MMYEKSHATIADILAAAQRLFVSNSYDDITMTRIAEEAGVTKGAIYHHFKGKEALFMQMMAWYLGELEATLQTAVNQPGSARQRLQHLTTLYLNKPLPEQRGIQLVRRDSNRFGGPSRDALIKAYQAALPNQIETILADGMASGEIMPGDARLLAWQFVAIVEVSLTSYARQQFNSPEKMAAYVTAVFFDGVAQRPFISNN